MIDARRWIFLFFYGMEWILKGFALAVFYSLYALFIYAIHFNIKYGIVYVFDTRTITIILVSMVWTLISSVLIFKLPKQFIPIPRIRRWLFGK